MAEELGFTLQEAIERYADVEKWQAYQKAANDVAELQCRTGSMSFALRPLREWDDDSGPTQYDTLERVRQHAEQAVVRDLWMRLYNGELEATGIVFPTRLDSQEERIPPRLFRVVGPNFRESSVEGNGIKIIDVRVRRRECPDPIQTPARSAEVTDDSKGNPLPIAEPVVTGPASKTWRQTWVA